MQRSAQDTPSMGAKKSFQIPLHNRSQQQLVRNNGILSGGLKTMTKGTALPKQTLAKFIIGETK